MVLDFRLSSQTIDEKTVKKSRFILYVAFSLCFIWPFINLAVLMLPTNGIYQIMIGTWGTASLFQIIFNLIAFISGTLLCVIHYRLETEHRRNDQFLLGLKVFGLLALMLISNLICQVFDGLSGCYHSFSSPDGLHTIVVGEEQIIHHVTITVYERLNPLIICSRDSDITDSTNKPIEENDYSVVWYEDSVAFFFDDGEKSILVSFD